jgi:VanZ family protein
MKKFTGLQWWATTGAYALILCLGSLRPVYREGPVSPLKEWAHNLLHVPAYAVLTFLLVKSLKETQTGYSFIVAAVISIAFGMVNEGLQSFSPGRFPSFLDVFLNAAGTLTAIGLIKRADRKR